MVLSLAIAGGIVGVRLAANRSSTLTSAHRPNTQILRSIGELASLKQQTGQNIYLMGGATITASTVDPGVVDELRLIIYPLIAGKGSALFAIPRARHALELRTVGRLPTGQLLLATASVATDVNNKTIQEFRIPGSPEVGTHTFTAHAQELIGPARPQLWPERLVASADLAAFDSGTARSIPLLLLRRLAHETAQT